MVLQNMSVFPTFPGFSSQSVQRIVLSGGLAIHFIHFPLKRRRKFSGFSLIVYIQARHASALIYKLILLSGGMQDPIFILLL